MNILIITTFFPPDTSIAAVRPHMLARYLAKIGNNVTVIRLGIIDKMRENIDISDEPYRVLTVIENSSGSEMSVQTVPENRQLSFLPDSIRNQLKRPYRAIKNQIDDIEFIKKSKMYFSMQKKVIDSLKGEKFDFVFSTYGELENVFAGEYAAKVLGAKWIMDLRDTITHYHLKFRPVWNLYAERMHKHILKKADAVTTVSYALSSRLKHKCQTAKVFTVTNGFDPKALEAYTAPQSDPKDLKICYTGQFYDIREEALRCLVKAIKKLISDGALNEDQISFEYAGSHSSIPETVFREYGISSVFHDLGYVDRGECLKIQRSSDIFLVLSWNTEKSIGVITGKFYEGITTGKPILTVVAGDTPDSELFEFYKKLHYGYCCECCKENAEKQLAEWLLKEYDRKVSGQSSEYRHTAAIEHFRYDNIALRLNDIMMDLQ